VIQDRENLQIIFESVYQYSQLMSYLVKLLYFYHIFYLKQFIYLQLILVFLQNVNHLKQGETLSLVHHTGTFYHNYKLGKISWYLKEENIVL